MRERLLVLVLGERVDRAELLAAAVQALDPGLEVGALVVVERLLGRLGLEPELGREAGELAPGLGGAVARLLGADLAARDLLAALLQPRLDLGLLGGARAQLAGELLAGLAVGAQLGLERLDPGGDGRAGACERLGEPLGGGAQRLVARQPRALAVDPLRALGALALRRARPAGARLASAASTWARRSAAGPSSGAARRCSISQPACRSASAASSRVAGRRAGLAVGLVARGVGGLDGLACARSTPASAALLGLRRALDLGDQRVAPVALGQHAVLAAGRHLAQLARGAATRRGRRA